MEGHRLLSYCLKTSFNTLLHPRPFCVFLSRADKSSPRWKRPPIQVSICISKSSKTNRIGVTAMSKVSDQPELEHQRCPISIHVPPSLQQLAVRPQAFLETLPSTDALVVGAFIFAAPPPTHTAHLLVIQRSAYETFANKWEIPGGGVETEDPTLLHSIAREVFEETGLHLSSIVHEVRPRIEFQSGTGIACTKLNFEIEVMELKEDELKALKDVEVRLDPTEHQAFRWITHSELEGMAEEWWMSRGQCHAAMTAFGMHAARRLLQGHEGSRGHP